MCIAYILVFVLLCFFGVHSKDLELVPRFHHSMEIFDGQLCVFGGKSTSTGVNLSDFLLDYRCVDVTKPINQARPRWKRQSSASRFAMAPLAQHTSVYDRANHIIVPYGGQTPSTFSTANHLAVYCTQFQAWGASNIVDSDPKRYVHTAVLQESSGDMIIFGGASDSTTSNSATPRWPKVIRMVLDSVRHERHAQKLGTSNGTIYDAGTIITDDGDANPKQINAVIQHASVIVNDTLMVVMGGNTFSLVTQSATNLPFDSVFIYDVDKLTWREQNCTGEIPSKRSAFTASRHKEFIYIYGGANITDWSAFGDMYRLDTNTWSWKKMPTPNAPVARYGHQMQTLGHYIIITNGFIEIGNGNSSGDKDIYFYDLNKEAFVDHYSPKGISVKELDTQWIVKRTQATKAIAAICFMLTLLVFFLALYYLIREIKGLVSQRQRPTTLHRAPAREGGIRSIVESYVDTWHNSVYMFDSKRPRLLSEERRPSQDADHATLGSKGGERRKSTFLFSSSDGNVRGRSQSVSEGTSTIVDGELALAAKRSQGAALENMRHTRVMDDTPNNVPYVSRKLTLSSRFATYRPRRPSELPNVRFSDYVEEIDEPENIAHDNTGYDNISIDSYDELNAQLKEPDDDVFEELYENNPTTAANVNVNTNGSDSSDEGGLHIVNNH